MRARWRSRRGPAAGPGRAPGGSRHGESGWIRPGQGALMRILVIDDYLNVEMALRGILDEHTVSGVRDPLALPRMLAHEAPFDQAIVDLRYAQSAATGLTALATLRELSPGTKTIISTTDEEENRLLYLLAAFQFFDPKALLAKRADAFVTRAVVEAVGR